MDTPARNYNRWLVVPPIGALVEADHPVTVANPTRAFEVASVKIERGGAYVRGEQTIWFNVEMIKPATTEI